MFLEDLEATLCLLLAVWVMSHIFKGNVAKLYISMCFSQDKFDETLSVKRSHSIYK